MNDDDLIRELQAAYGDNDPDEGVINSDTLVITVPVQTIHRQDLPKRHDVIDHSAALSIAYALPYTHESLIVIPVNDDLTAPEGATMMLVLEGNPDPAMIYMLTRSYVAQHGGTGWWTILGCWLTHPEAHPNQHPTRWAIDAEGGDDLLMEPAE